MNSLMFKFRVAVRVVGDTFNLAALAAFAWAAVHLEELALHHYEMALPLPSFDRGGFEALLSDQERMISLWHLGASWVFAVAAAGSAWMAVLGGRWAYHFVLRTANR
jgi:TRAP-type C4-dicarboxylate transport system permease small subunit